MPGKEDIMISDVKLEGFQPIRGVYFSKPILPTLSIRINSFQFNMQAYEELSSCECVQFLINLEEKRIAIEPVPSNNPNAVHWLKGAELKKPSRISCGMLTTQLFESWGWNSKYYYRANGRLVKSDKKLMLLFDFNSPAIFNGLKAVRDNGE